MVFGFGSSPFLSDPRKYADKHYDYVIIGGGTAGSVLASRLSEDANVSVCVLEAGGDPSGVIETKVPAAFGKLFKSKHDWDYETEEEEQVGGRRMQLPRGKMLGGSSSMNAMMYQRCPPSDLDEWKEKYGCEGWDNASLTPYYRRSQKFTMNPQRPTIDLSHHSVDGDGTWQVGYSWLSKPGEAFIDACDASGVPRNPDVNDGKHPIGATRFQTFIDQKGCRSSAFTAYLPPSVTSRSNLTIAINTHVTRILLEGAEPVATGAEFQLKRDGPRHRVYANKEVILCGGAYNSPQTMLLSGLGPAEELKKHNIPLVKDMPDVGRNLYDHVCTSGLYGRTSSSAHSLDYLASDIKSIPALIRWLATGGGPMTTNVGEAAAFARMADFDSKVEDHGSLGFGPDVEYIHTPLCFRDHGATTTPAGSPGTISIAVIGLRPLSKGTVTLRSNSVFDKAVIRHNYWHEENDRRVLIAGVRKGLEIFHSKSMDPYVDRSYINDDEDSFYWPVSSSNYRTITDEQIIRWMHSNSFTLYHAVGTIRMGVDDKAPLDLQLRVRGVKGLRVCDASVMPGQIACHPTATIIAIAEKTSDIIRGKVAVNDDATRLASVGAGAPVAQSSRL